MSANVEAIQVWNNAAFDNDSVDFASSKENIKPLISENYPKMIRPLEPTGATENLKIKAMKHLHKEGLIENHVVGIKEEKNIDTEIEGIEKELNRLSAKLHVLKLEKAERCVNLTQRPEQIDPGKVLEQKQNVKKKGVENLKFRSQRKGASMCPGEIIGGLSRRGMSLGPWEIAAGIKSRQLRKPEINPVQSIQSSGFCKLQDIDEMKVSKERVKRLSLSLKSRRAMCNNQGLRQALTTVGSRKAVKKDDTVLAAIQPKKLFQGGEKIVSNKKPQKPCRVIASRYNQGTAQSAMRKRSLPENDRDESTRCDQKRFSSVGKLQGAMHELSCTESRVKKRNEIPGETVCGALKPERSQLSICVVPPKIRTTRCTIDTPRDSGPAKRVAELIGKKSFFGNDHEVVDSSVCQELNFEQEE